MMPTLATTLANPIRQQHQRVQQAVADALMHAREAGRLLSDARPQIPHGGWIPFVEQCGMSRSTAAGYVRIFERWAELEPNVQRVAHLPLRQALKLLAEPAVGAYPEIPDGQAMTAIASGDRKTLTAVVWPSDNLAFVFYNVLVTNTENDDAWIDGGKRAIRKDLAMEAMERSGFPVQSAEWQVKPAEPWSYNEYLYESPEDFHRRGVLGGDGFIDNPAVLVSADEHAAFIARSGRRG